MRKLPRRHSPQSANGHGRDMRCNSEQMFWGQFAVGRRNLSSVAVIAPTIAPSLALKHIATRSAM